MLKSIYEKNIVQWNSQAKQLLERVGAWLEKTNKEKDAYLFRVFLPHWPRNITPNHLTFIRIAIGLFLFALLFNFRINNGFIIIPLFFVGIITDLLDGVVARGLHMETKVGETLDPIADRVIIVPIAVYSLVGDNTLLMCLLLVTEIVNALLSLFTQGKNIFFGSNIYGKTKMVLQSAVFMGILLFWPLRPNIIFIGLLWASLIFMLLSIESKLRHIKAHYQRQILNPKPETLNKSQIPKS